MDVARLLKWIAVVVVILIVWRVVLPKLNEPSNDKPTSKASSVSSSDGNCAKRAEGASETWGSGLHQFANPPYDLGAWSSFRSEVDGKISNALSDCNCADESCQKATAAMRDLRAFVSEMDTAIRNGSSPPDDAVQRQEHIDNQITEAADLQRAGK